jgi:hypothetical protein
MDGTRIFGQPRKAVPPALIGLTEADHNSLSDELAHYFLGDIRNGISGFKSYFREYQINFLVLPNITHYRDELRSGAMPYASQPPQ